MPEYRKLTSVPRMPSIWKTYPVCQEYQEYEKLTTVPRLPRIWNTYRCAKVPSRPCHGSWRPQGWAQGCQGWWPACWSWPSGYLRWVFLLFSLLVRVPAKLGARSAWLENTPENMLKIQVDLNKEMETSSTDIFLIDRCVTAFTWGANRWLKNTLSPSIQHHSKDSERHHYQNVLASKDDCNLWTSAINFVGNSRGWNVR